MQTRYIAHQKARLARVLIDIEKTNATQWDPSREDLMKLRQLTRNKYTCRMAYEELRPNVSMETFRRKTKKYGIIFEQTYWGNRCAK